MIDSSRKTLLEQYSKELEGLFNTETFNQSHQAKGHETSGNSIDYEYQFDFLGCEGVNHCRIDESTNGTFNLSLIEKIDARKIRKEYYRDKSVDEVLAIFKERYESLG